MFTQNSQILNLTSSSVGHINGIKDSDYATVNELFKVWRNKYPRNLLRSAYYDARNKFIDLKIAIPPQIAHQATSTIGWAEKSVRALADKSVFEGFDVPETDQYGIKEIVESNQLDVDVSQLIISAYKHSCSFLTIYADKSDEHMVLMPRSADWASALWDRRARCISAAMTITDCDKDGNITAFTVWLPYKNYECVHVDGKWFAEEVPTNMPHPMVVPFVYDQQMDRPFGHSRINRALMALTDTAFRTMVRMESTAEFYSYPQLWFLGLDPDAMTTDAWKIAINSINSISRDEDGNVPTMQQVSQASMSPHGDMMETLVMQVASITDLTPETLGMRVSNPSSAEALAASESWLTRTANRQNIAFGRQLKNALRMAIQARSRLAAPPDLSAVTPIWAPTREVSDAARADYYQKIAAQNPVFANSTTGLRKAGLTLSEIQQVRRDERRQKAAQAVQDLAARINQTQDKQEVTDNGQQTNNTSSVETA